MLGTVVFVALAYARPVASAADGWVEILVAFYAATEAPDAPVLPLAKLRLRVARDEASVATVDDGRHGQAPILVMVARMPRTSPATAARALSSLWLRIGVTLVMVRIYPMHAQRAIGTTS